MSIDWLDLPKLKSLTAEGEDRFSFYAPSCLVLESDSPHSDVMSRYAQSRRFASPKCIQLCNTSHMHWRYALHPSLTTRHRSPCSSQESPATPILPSLFYTRFVSLNTSSPINETPSPFNALFSVDSQPPWK